MGLNLKQEFEFSLEFGSEVVVDEVSLGDIMENQNVTEKQLKKMCRSEITDVIRKELHSWVDKMLDEKMNVTFRELEC